MFGLAGSVSWTYAVTLIAATGAFVARSGQLFFVLSSGAAVVGSAIFFGGFFIIGSGLLALWTMSVFYAWPPAGVGAIVSVIALGQLVGPALTGLLSGRIGLAPTFYGAGVLMAALEPVVPRMDRRAGAPAP